MGSQTRKLAKHTDPPPKKDGESGAPTGWFAWWMFLDRVTERFGPAGAVLAFVFVCVKWFATAETQDRIMKELFFGSETKGHWVQGFFASLLLLVALDARLLWRYLSGERRELKRVADEKTKLQEQLLAQQLSHTREPD